MRMEGIEETIPELETGSIETNHIKQQRDNKRMNKQANKQKQSLWDLWDSNPISAFDSPESQRERSGEESCGR
mgnify:CR=1 FL=1